ncbi:MAG: cell division protein SepF [Promethearchaeota archaeon]
MLKFWKKDEELINSPREAMGISRTIESFSGIQNYLIKMYKLTSTTQIREIKDLLLKNNVLIINAKEILEDNAITIEELKDMIDELREFIAKYGGSIGRIGDQYLILTPNVHIRISSN